MSLIPKWTDMFVLFFFFFFYFFVVLSIWWVNGQLFGERENGGETCLGVKEWKGVGDENWTCVSQRSFNSVLWLFLFSFTGPRVVARSFLSYERGQALLLWLVDRRDWTRPSGKLIRLSVPSFFFFRPSAFLRFIRSCCWPSLLKKKLRVLTELYPSSSWTPFLEKIFSTGTFEVDPYLASWFPCKNFVKFYKGMTLRNILLIGVITWLCFQVPSHRIWCFVSSKNPFEWELGKLLPKPLALDLMEIPDLFFRKDSYHQNTSYKKIWRQRCCWKTFNLQTLFCLCFVQSSSKEAMDLPFIGPKFPWGAKLEVFAVAININSGHSTIWNLESWNLQLLYL
jgi:hypothetical protein